MYVLLKGGKFMYVRTGELELLHNVCDKLTFYNETELANQLEKLINRLETSRQAMVDDSRMRQEINRKNGYKWKSSYHPKKSKYYPETEDKQTENSKNKNEQKIKQDDRREDKQMKTYIATFFRENSQSKNTMIIQAYSIISARKKAFEMINDTIQLLDVVEKH